MSCLPGMDTKFYRLKKEFRKSDKDHEVYPYEVPGAIVLGPETIAAIDGSSIVWRGVQYLRADGVLLPDPYNEYKEA